MALRGYYLGCPGWGMKSWVGRLFPAGTKDKDFLARYAEVFNSVEGNTTFYALPSAESALRWGDQVPADFRFCFKFPREVTHDRLLIDASAEVQTFLSRIAPIAEAGKLGTLMLQLPPRFTADQLDRLRAFLAALPKDHHYAVELREAAFYRAGPEQDAAMELLRERGVDLVIMDTRGIHSSKSLTHAETRARKPSFPPIVRATAGQPIVRFVPHETLSESRAFLEPWAPQLAAWIEEGKRPYFFMHAPDDTFAPQNAYAFHALLAARADVGTLPPWPGAPRQQSLF